MLLQYRGQATLAQAFAIVKQFDKNLHIEEAGRSSLVMATTSSSPKATIVGPSKTHRISKSMKQVAMVVEVEEVVNPPMWCGNCRLLDHGKRNCPSDKSSNGKNGS